MGANKLVPALLTVLVSLSVSISSSQMTALAKDDSSPLGAVEQRLFFKTYGEDTDAARLERIEKRVFGTVMQGSFQERLSKVSEASQPQVNPDGTMTGNVQQNDVSTAGGAISAPAKTPAQIQEEERQAALDRARISVQAAKEEEAARDMAEGVELWRGKHGTEALQKFEQVTRLEPNNAEAYYSSGIIYESMGNLIEALSEYNKAADIRSDNNEYTDAVKAIQKKISAAQNISPKQAEINRLTTQASAAYKRNEFLSAVDLYKQLDALNPNQALVKYNLGTLYLQIKDPFTALQYYKQATTLNPKEPRYATAYQKLQSGVDKEEAQQQQTEAQWKAAGYDLSQAGTPQDNSGNASNMAPAQSGPAINQPGNRRPALTMGQQASAQGQGQNNPSTANQFQQQQQRTLAPISQSNPFAQTSSATMSPPQGFLQGANVQAQIPATGTPLKPNKLKSSKQPNALQQASQRTQSMPQQQQAPMQQPQQQVQQMPQQQMDNQQFNQSGGFSGGNPTFNQNVSQSSAPIDPQTAIQRQMQLALQQSMAQGVIPPNFGAPANAPVNTTMGNGNMNSNAAQTPNLAGNIPVNTFKPNFARTPGAQSSNNNAATKPAANNPSTPANNKFGADTPPPDAAATYGIIAGATKEGIKATTVGIGSRASRAGLRRGDIIRAVDGNVLRSVQQLNDVLSKKNGGSVQIYVQRNALMATLTL